MKPMNEKHFAILRRHMVDIIAIHTDVMEDELGKPVLDERVIAAMLRVPRHLCVPEPLASLAYEDRPLPIGFEKTISQPFMCALMTDLLAPDPADIILEVGTGLGYQTAILAELVNHVWSVEIVEELAEGAQQHLSDLGYTNVDIRIGDGSRGWSDHAPYDKILVAASHEKIPDDLLEQLKPGGRLVMPLGSAEDQQLTLAIKDDEGAVRMRKILAVRFTRLETVI
jgi:protein-L-isoaspartate(D-aspartate) O-methyltransferase